MRKNNLLGLILFLLLVSLVPELIFVEAVENYTLSERTNNLYINEWAQCKFANNLNAVNRYFVPTKSSVEWTNFITNKPVDVTLDPCYDISPDGVYVGAEYYYYRSCGGEPFGDYFCKMGENAAIETKLGGKCGLLKNYRYTRCAMIHTLNNDEAISHGAPCLTAVTRVLDWTKVRFCYGTYDAVLNKCMYSGSIVVDAVSAEVERGTAIGLSAEFGRLSRQPVVYNTWGTCYPSAPCGDSICSSAYGETCASCSSDCGACPIECGDGICVDGEDCGFCNYDCGDCVDGDGICSPPYETCWSSPGDCGDCPPPVCGSNGCESGETCRSCPTDCGTYCFGVSGDGICDSGWGESCETSTYDCGVCECGDYICTFGDYLGYYYTEDCSSCDEDCGSCYCGDGSCNGLETCATCPSECGVCPPRCGDGTCNGVETCASCSRDCGTCPPVCGDGSCNGAETSWTCYGDCPAVCGDGTCFYQYDEESCSSCASDCGECAPYCGDGSCTEGCRACPADCGTCPVYCGDRVCEGDETCNSCDIDCGECCGNGDCEYGFGESCSNCAGDCGICLYCGDGSCNNGETCSSCIADCGSCCGNGACAGGETCSSCSRDCGTCPPVCGDGTCTSGWEDYTSCSDDCVDCTTLIKKSMCILEPTCFWQATAPIGCKNAMV